LTAGFVAAALLLSFKLARNASMMTMTMTLPLVRDAIFAIGWPLYFV
jgi:hypothetical protein